MNADPQLSDVKVASEASTGGTDAADDATQEKTPGVAKVNVGEGVGSAVDGNEDESAVAGKDEENNAQEMVTVFDAFGRERLVTREEAARLQEEDVEKVERESLSRSASPEAEAAPYLGANSIPVKAGKWVAADTAPPPDVLGKRWGKGVRKPTAKEAQQSAIAELFQQAESEERELEARKKFEEELKPLGRGRGAPIVPAWQKKVGDASSTGRSKPFP